MKRILMLAAALLTITLQAQEKVGDDLTGTETNEQWGYSAELSDEGRLLVIGGPFKGESQGSFIVYAAIFGTWNFQWGINGVVGGTSGLSVDLSDDGNVTAVGSPTTLQGQVNVFEKTGIQYEALGSPIQGPAELSNQFGAKVSLSGDGTRLAVGAPSYNGAGEDRGYVAVFELVDETWQRVGEPIIGTFDFALKGKSLDLSYDGTILAIGSPFSFDNLNPGTVEVYTLSGDVWQTVGDPIMNGPDMTGSVLALSSDGNRMIVGRPISDIASVYELRGNIWTKIGGDIRISTSRVSGFSADISGDGNRVIVGAFGSNAQSLPGAVQIFDYDGTSWTAATSPVAGEVGEAFGWHCSLSPDGTAFAVGSPGSESPGDNQGHVEVYSIDPVSTAVLSHTIEDIFISPNPAAREIQISGDDVNSSRSVMIVDNTGKTVMNGFLRNGAMNIESIPAGMYHVLVPFGEDHRVAKRLMKL